MLAALASVSGVTVEASANTPFGIAIAHPLVAGSTWIASENTASFVPVLQYDHNNLLTSFGQSGEVTVDVKYTGGPGIELSDTRRQYALAANQGASVGGEITFRLLDDHPVVVGALVTISCGGRVQLTYETEFFIGLVDNEPVTLTQHEAATADSKRSRPLHVVNDGELGESTGLPDTIGTCGNGVDCISPRLQTRSAR